MASPDLRPGGFSPEALFLRPNEAALTYEQLGTLVALNPNSRNLNKSNYEITFGSKGEKFNPGSFDPVNVVWVQTDPEVKKLLIRDGHHRTSATFKHWRAINDKFPSFKFTIRDVTDDYSPKKEEVKPKPARQFSEELEEAPNLTIHASAADSPRALTMPEYIRILVEPTQVQKDILSLRVALTLMQGWRSFVGSDDLDKKFPALAAFSMLAQSDIRISRPEEAGEFIKRQTNFFPDATPEERNTLREALGDMVGVMRDHNVIPKQVLESSFVIIGTTDEYLDVSDAIKKQQVEGLVNSSILHNKLQAAYGEAGAKRKKDTAKIAFLYGLPNDRLRAEQSGRVLHETIMDSRLTGAETMAVLTHSGNKEKKREELLKQYQRSRLTAAYLMKTGKDGVSEKEKALIERFCGPGDIEDWEKTSMIQLIQKAPAAISGAEQFLEKLGDPKKLGVDDQTRAKLISDLTKALKAARSRRGRFLVTSLTQLDSLVRNVPFYVERATVSVQPVDEAAPAVSKDEPVKEMGLNEKIIYHANQLTGLLGQVTEDSEQLGSDAGAAVLQVVSQNPRFQEMSQTVKDQTIVLAEMDYQLGVSQNTVRDLEAAGREKDTTIEQLRAENEVRDSQQHGSTGSVEGEDTEAGKVELGEGQVIVSREELDWLRANVVWWRVVPGLTPTEQAVAKAHAEGKQGLFLQRNLTITKSMYFEYLERAFATKQRYDQSQTKGTN